MLQSGRRQAGYCSTGLGDSSAAWRGASAPAGTLERTAAGRRHLSVSVEGAAAACEAAVRGRVPKSCVHKWQGRRHTRRSLARSIALRVRKWQGRRPAPRSLARSRALRKVLLASSAHVEATLRGQYHGCVLVLFSRIASLATAAPVWPLIVDRAIGVCVEPFPTHS